MKKCNISIGFIGGGRITRIILQALKQKGIQCKSIKVYDPDSSQIEKLQSVNEQINSFENAAEAADANLVFLAVHPPEVKNSLEAIKNSIKTETLLVSLAPKIKIEDINQILDKSCPVIRMIPNAPSVINKGYNVIAYSNNLTFESNERHQQVKGLLEGLGELIHVDREDKLEAYAVITGMGPPIYGSSCMNYIRLQKNLEWKIRKPEKPSVKWSKEVWKPSWNQNSASTR